MANTYIGYAERSAESQINWAEVGAQVSDMLNTEQKIRDDKRQEIDDATREYQKALADAPKGQSDRINGFTNDFVNKAQEQLLMTNRLLKSGQLDMKDYLNIRQNLTDQTGQMFDTLNKAQEYVKMHQDRLDSDEASAAEAMLMDQLTGFMNFKDTSSYVDAPTGILSIAKTKDGKMSTDPNAFMTIGQMDEGFNTFVDKFKVDDALAGMEKQLGDVLNSTLRQAAQSGELSRVEQTKDKKTGKYTVKGDEDESIGNFLTMEDKYVKGLLTNKSHALSVLVDYVPGDYTISYNPEDKGKTIDGKEVVFINREKGFNEVELTKDQEERAVSFLKERFRSKIGVEKKVTDVREKSYAPKLSKDERENAELVESQENVATLWNEYWYADDKRREIIGDQITSSKYVEKENQLLTFNISEDPDNKDYLLLDFKYLNEKRNPPEPIKISKDISQADWAALGTRVHGYAAQDAIEVGGGLAEGQKFNPNVATVTGKQGNIDYVTKLMEEYVEKGGAGFTPNVFALREKGVQKKLNPILAKFGLRVNQEDIWDSRKISIRKIKSGDKVTGTLRVHVTDSDAQKELFDTVVDAIRTNITDEQAEKIYKGIFGNAADNTTPGTPRPKPLPAGVTPYERDGKTYYKDPITGIEIEVA